jgi:hypothetical protein
MPDRPRFDELVEIENAGEVTAVFGHWPSFHDAEVLRIGLQRAPGAATLEATVHVFDTTSEVDKRGTYVTTNHSLVTLRFSGLRLHCIKWFNHQNAIDELEILHASDGEGRLSVHLASNWGCDAEVNCDNVAVVSLVPYTEDEMVRDGSVYAAKNDGKDPL